MSEAAGMMFLMKAINAWNVGVLVACRLWDRLETQIGSFDIVALALIYTVTESDRKTRKARSCLARARKIRCLVETSS